MKKEDFIYEDASLLKKVITGEATKKEFLQADEMLNKHPELKKYIEELKSNSISEDDFFSDLDNYSTSNAYSNFLSKIHHKSQRHIKQAKWWYAAAAVIFITLSTISVHQLFYSVSPKAVLTIGPGSEKGKLELSNGITLDIKKKDFKMTVDNISLQYTKGTLICKTTAKEKEIKQKKELIQSEKMEYNKFIIPRGGENSAILSDGTKVYLNADSKLIYPVEFKGKERHVILEGEGFFNVTKDANHPFIVETKYGNIRVLGTSFNVNAYDDRGACYTTLVTGKVNITTPEANSINLEPGEQAVITSNSLSKHKVETDNYASWVTGIYIFHNETLKEIMSAFEKWYDVKVIYDNPAIENLVYTGNVRRNITINSFLDAFEITGDFKYRIKEDRHIYLYK